MWIYIAHSRKKKLYCSLFSLQGHTTVWRLSFVSDFFTVMVFSRPYILSTVALMLQSVQCCVCRRSCQPLGRQYLQNYWS